MTARRRAAVATASMMRARRRAAVVAASVMMTVVTVMTGPGARAHDADRDHQRQRRAEDHVGRHETTLADVEVEFIHEHCLRYAAPRPAELAESGARRAPRRV